MKKKLVCILITTLFISIIAFPIANAIKIEKTEIVTLDRPKIEIFLPDVHVYFPKSHIQWGNVEFDEPGAIIDVDLSGVEENEVLLAFTHKIICHVEGRILPVLVISSISRPEESASSNFEYIGSSDNWKRTVHHGYYVTEKVEDETYPLIVAVTGVPTLYKWAVGIYYWLMLNFFPALIFDIPTPLEETYGSVIEYQLHVHT